MENKTVKPAEAEWESAPPRDTWRNYSATGRLAALLAVVTFCALFMSFEDANQGLIVATLSAYSVFAFGAAFRDKNCSLRRPQVRGHLVKFAFMHVPFLLLVYAIESEWLDLTAQMPHWLVARGRKGSLYEYILAVSIGLIAWWQANWMRAIVKRSICLHKPD